VSALRSGADLDPPDVRSLWPGGAWWRCGVCLFDVAVEVTRPVGTVERVLENWLTTTRSSG
jgi:hypothetical protein